MILRNLVRRPLRTLLTLLGIAIGVAAVVSLGAMAKGMVENYSSSIGLSNDLLIIQANAFDPIFSSLDDDLSARIHAVPEVENVDPGVYAWIATDDLPFFLVFGYQPGSKAMGHYRIVEGKPVTTARQIALGRRAAESLKLEVGERVDSADPQTQLVRTEMLEIRSNLERGVKKRIHCGGKQWLELLLE